MRVTGLVVVGLLCAPAELAAAETTFLVDGGLLLDATSSVEGGRSELHGILALRGGALWSFGGALHVGGDLRLGLEGLPRVRGTEDVGSIAWEIGLEPRGLLAWRFFDGPISLSPYAFAGVLGGARLLDLYSFGDHRFRGHPTVGVRGGAGSMLRVGGAALSLELGAGWREDGPEIVGALLAGTAF